ncbi:MULTISPECIES: ABC transporter ATP-binding protein [Bacillaceae]|uniref:ABC transporter ATP-binding protein n=1 Tax=Bacillaceae TaxID=186817 RepID=UPI000BEBD455|nr:MULTISPECIES: ABC transporter ATP-binding protein [unclassified Bacillus (in: firmicutes)]PEC49247.1 cobalamin/Fe(3+)-siderophore ABC transporter ATP-binding protein [Bacillus sp. AFS096315]PFM82507.1 cobalamin/Fe(3+)-siderophore ABC transporter ATP-binding protein [Bacillus sp. AFS077874]
MSTSAIETEKLTLSYDDRTIINELNFQVPKGKITVLIGANGCGKSTLLRSLARLLQPKSGTILLDGKEISKRPTKEIARNLSILPQSPVAPEGLTVFQLVKQGRYPYQTWLKQWSKEDEEKVNHALKMTNMYELKDQLVDSLSGGQRQRAWIAMTLAQDTDTILLDEPTTYLDLTHQIEILDLLYELNEKEQRTIVMVLHDINLACRYAHNVVAISNGEVYAEGDPENIINQSLICDVFCMNCDIVKDPLFGTPLCIPHGRGRKII